MGWDNDNWGRMHDFNANHGYYGVVMGILFLIFLGLAIWTIVRLVRNGKQTSNVISNQIQGRETPREILDRRFAKGEINADEYQRAKELLG
jgi:putative membrane protein